MQRTVFKKLILILSIILLLLCLAWVVFLRTPIIPQDGLTYVVKRGDTVKDIANGLNKKADLEQPLLFELFARLTGESRYLKAGEYFLEPNSTTSQVLALIISGKVVNHSFTIVNGWNIYDVIDALDKDEYLKHTLAGLTPKQIAQKMGLKYTTPEGWLYPNTYFFTLNDTDISILNRAYFSMKKHLALAWKVRAKHLSYRSDYQALIVASMVEKEASLKRERPVIAGIILKRLKIWMPLQIDSTVIYGLLPNFNGHLTRQDLREKTPYNTYAKYGLPLTPIAMPDSDAIYAALHPVKTNAWYFVARGDGSHEFSATLAEQRKAIKKYILAPAVKPQNGK